MKPKPDKILCFKTSAENAKIVDSIAKRHSRTRANMLNLFLTKMIDLEKKGELDDNLSTK